MLRDWINEQAQAAALDKRVLALVAPHTRQPVQSVDQILAQLTCYETAEIMASLHRLWCAELVSRGHDGSWGPSHVSAAKRQRRTA